MRCCYENMNDSECYRISFSQLTQTILARLLEVSSRSSAKIGASDYTCRFPGLIRRRTLCTSVRVLETTEARDEEDGSVDNDDVCFCMFLLVNVGYVRRIRDVRCRRKTYLPRLDIFRKYEVHNISQASVRCIITNVSVAITGLALRYVRFPREEKRITLRESLTTSQDSLQVIGAIDGTHIPITNVGGELSQIYINRKGWYSLLNVQLRSWPQLSSSISPSNKLVTLITLCSMQQHKYNNERGVLTTLHQTPENDWDRRISSSYKLLGSCKEMNLAYQKAMKSTNIRSEFSKMGVYPFHPSSLTDEALIASKLKDMPTLGSQQTQGDLPEERVCSAKRRQTVTDLLKTPTYDPKKKRTVNRKIDVRVMCLALPTKPPADASPQKSTKSSQGKPSTSRASSNDKNWVCGVCNGSYNADF
ncbi:hypothetical protein ANN_24556 [Periplaneta americana]|uniref:DDE Tnp4 domain-containing protein n=1 Tax=Periplaneta americana TaxID=6978 RepID=A0ABQ8S3C3_PERAM|nr:hypothetical protein ANN_24556 [Periplaneta americana]